ncbi:hypothetical protein [Oscillatoria acuminata]|nr:hypothetical protein [Oscillatoria acuminata]
MQIIVIFRNIDDNWAVDKWSLRSETGRGEVAIADDHKDSPLG